MLSWWETHMLPCAYKTIFGFDCPICGFQRSLLLLLKGDFKASFIMYPPLLLVLILIAFAVIKLLRPALVAKKYMYRYSAFVLGFVAVNYAVKITMLLVG